jgi:uncharacterized protein
LTYVPLVVERLREHVQHRRTYCSLHTISSAIKPKNSSTKGSKKRTPAAETTLVPHRAPNLTDLLERAKRGKLSDVHQYLSAGGSPNVLQPLKSVGLAPLLSGVAASRHKEAADSIKLLLQAGAAVDAISSSTEISERTALMVACSVPNNLKSVQALLQGGADPCHQASDGVSALHLAASAGHAETCRALYSASSGRALQLTSKDDGLSVTPLMIACATDQYAVVELLCALGADVNYSSVTGTTALIAAVEEPDTCTSVLRFLLRQDGIQVNYSNRSGDTALMKATKAGNGAAVQLLLQNGADTCNINNDGLSALSLAVAAGHLHVLKLLMQHGVDISATTPTGMTLLMYAAISQPRTAEFLINNGISVHALDHNGSSALHYAAISGQLDSLKVLIAAGADVLQSDATGSTALHAAVRYGHSVAVKLLLEHDADAVLSTMQCKRWSNCCHVSALMMCNDTAILKLLLAAGADVHAVTCCGHTCLHIATSHSNSAPVVCLLIKAGADMHAVNKRGKTAAEVARHNGNTLIEQLLIRAAQQA